ncbi:IspE 4-diphosphocytidyl-2C-methyl-D-erythritol 2-phosphate synthase [Candidatus Pelagibacterales bacterium]
MMLTKKSLKAYGKINLYLKVIKKLKNKYHEIESLFCFFNVYDEIFVSANRTYSQIIFTGKFSKGINNTNNTILKLFNILKKYPKFNKLKFKIRIVKNIPQGSGFGGGSVDVSVLLNFFNKYLKLNLKKNTISSICNKIGADVEPSLNTNFKILYGSNKIIEFKKKPKFNLLLVYPNCFNSTKNIYLSNKIFSKKNNSEIYFLKKNILNMNYLIKFLNYKGNDLEQSAFKKNKTILKLLTFLKKLKGCKIARMTGSGSACFAVFENNAHLAEAILTLKKHYKSYWIRKAKII